MTSRSQHQLEIAATVSAPGKIGVLTGAGKKRNAILDIHKAEVVSRRRRDINPVVVQLDCTGPGVEHAVGS